MIARDCARWLQRVTNDDYKGLLTITKYFKGWLQSNAKGGCKRIAEMCEGLLQKTAEDDCKGLQRMIGKKCKVRLHRIAKADCKALQGMLAEDCRVWLQGFQKGAIATACQGWLQGIPKDHCKGLQCMLTKICNSWSRRIAKGNYQVSPLPLTMSYHVSVFFGGLGFLVSVLSSSWYRNPSWPKFPSQDLPPKAAWSKWSFFF